MGCLLQSSQASCQHPVVYRALGLTETHRLLAQVAVWWWQSWLEMLLVCIIRQFPWVRNRNLELYVFRAALRSNVIIGVM